MDDTFCQNFGIFEDIGGSKIRTGSKDLVILEIFLEP